MQTLIQHPDNLTYINDVPFVVWCYWEGEEMNGNRKLSFEYLQKNIEVPLGLITPINLSSFIKDNHPLPKDFDKLSIVHRSDYIRTYLMHHYGGGWHDIKATEVSYKDVWQKFSNKNIWIIGKKEIKGGAAKTKDHKGRYIPDYYQDLIAVPTWVAKPNTELSKNLLLSLEKTIADNADLLNKYPAKHPREKKLPNSNFLKKGINILKFIYQKRSLNYPLEWTLFGNAFHPLILEYKEHVSYNLPTDKKKNAGIYHRG